MKQRFTPGFEITVRILDSHILVEVMGEFDVSTIDRFDAGVDSRALDDRLLIIDLDQVTLMDSAAIGAVLRLVQIRRDRGAPTRVVADRPYQRRLFEITGLSHLTEPGS